MYSLFPAPADPTLPEFQSLLVKGPYHASAPVHLLLSHSAVHPEAKAILLTPRRSTIQHALVDMKDEWLDQNSGHGRVGAASRRTEVFYPPTLAHLRLLLSMLHEYDGVLHHAKTTLDVAPSLLVLHELSAYFDVQAAETTASAYLSVVSCALSLSASWSPRCATPSKLVVFDSGLADLKLPILRPLSFSDQPGETERYSNTVSVLLERYFEWQADVRIVSEGEGDEMDDAQEEDAKIPVQRTLALQRCRERHSDIAEPVDEPVVWQWKEVVRTTGEAGVAYTTFVWEHTEE